MPIQNEIFLPDFLNDYIYNKLNASFSPDPYKFCKNLTLTKDEVLVYLGTYFPRSFAETYSIFNNLLQNERIKNTFRNKESIIILDIGSGSGGNLVALLLSIIENVSEKMNFNIIVIDGNVESLKILNKIILHFRKIFNANISLSSHYIVFKTIKELHDDAKKYFLYDNYDLISSSKLINEIYINDQDSYYNFYNLFAKYLHEDGLIYLLDVTTKINGQFLPIELNRQTNKFIKENNQIFKTLIPTSCSKFENICEESCFTNNIFYVSHKMKRHDKSKVTYRIIGRYDFINKILSESDSNGNIVGFDDYGNKKLCKLNQCVKEHKSAFELK